MTTQHPPLKEPEGELALQTVAMPTSANVYGDIFGGWLVSKMDLAGAVMAHQRAKNRVTTVAMDSLVFLKPVYMGDLVACYAKTAKTGRSSITINVQVWARRMRICETVHVAEGIFTYVALDDKGKSKKVDWSKTESEEKKE